MLKLSKLTDMLSCCVWDDVKRKYPDAFQVLSFRRAIRSSLEGFSPWKMSLLSTYSRWLSPWFSAQRQQIKCGRGRLWWRNLINRWGNCCQCWCHPRHKFIWGAEDYVWEFGRFLPSFHKKDPWSPRLDCCLQMYVNPFLRRNFNISTTACVAGMIRKRLHFGVVLIKY